MMTWQQGIAELRRALWNRIDQKILMTFGWTLTAKGSSMGDTDQVQTVDQADSTVGKGRQRPARRLEPWGLRGFPVAKVRTFWVRLGSSNVIYLGIAPTKGYGPTDLAEGETVVYSEKVERALWATKDGDTKLAAASGRKVEVAGDTYAMPTWDPYSTDLDTFLAAIAGIVTPVATLPQCAAALNAIIAAAIAFQGSKAAAQDYKSQNATNG